MRLVEIVGDEDIFGEETIVEPDDSQSSAFNESFSSLAGGPNTEYSADGIVVICLGLALFAMLRPGHM